MTGDERQIGGFDLIYRDNKRIGPNLIEFNNNFNPHITTHK